MLLKLNNFFYFRKKQFQTKQRICSVRKTAAQLQAATITRLLPQRDTAMATRKPMSPLMRELVE